MDMDSFPFVGLQPTQSSCSSSGGDSSITEYHGDLPQRPVSVEDQAGLDAYVWESYALVQPNVFATTGNYTGNYSTDLMSSHPANISHRTSISSNHHTPTNGMDYGQTSPGRKSDTEKQGGLTPEAKTKRKEQNRAAQRAYRQRREQQVRDMESRLDHFNNTVTSLQADNAKLKRQLRQAKVERKLLKRSAAAGGDRSSAVPQSTPEQSGLTLSTYGSSDGSSDDDSSPDAEHGGSGRCVKCVRLEHSLRRTLEALNS